MIVTNVSPRGCIRANRQIIARLFTLSCKQSTKLPPSLCALQSIKYMLVLFQEIPKQLSFLNCWNFVGCYTNSTSNHALFTSRKSKFFESLFSDINTDHPFPPFNFCPLENPQRNIQVCIVHPAPAAYCATTCRDDSDSTFWLGMKISELLIFQISTSFQHGVHVEKSTSIRMSDHSKIF